MNETRIQKVRDIDWRKQYQNRAGTILHAKRDGYHYFCLGIDRRHREYTDFGGGVTKRDRDTLDSALREYHEETLDIHPIDKRNTGDSFVVYDRNMLILFYEVDDYIMEPSVDLFCWERQKHIFTENIEISWLSLADIFSLINSK